MNTAKPWWRSKTLWINLLAVIGSITASYGMDAKAWAEISVTALAVVNILLRLTTHEGLDTGGEETGRNFL